MFILYCKTLLLLLRWDTGKVKDWFGGMGWFKGGLKCKDGSMVIINVITKTNYRCNYKQIFFKIKYNVKTGMYTQEVLCSKLLI